MGLHHDAIGHVGIGTGCAIFVRIRGLSRAPACRGRHGVRSSRGLLGCLPFSRLLSYFVGDDFLSHRRGRG